MEHVRQIKVQATKRNCTFAIHGREWIVFEELHTRKWDQSCVEVITRAFTIGKQTPKVRLELYILVKWKGIDHNFEASPIIFETERVSFSGDCIRLNRSSPLLKLFPSNQAYKETVYKETLITPPLDCENTRRSFFRDDAFANESQRTNARTNYVPFLTFIWNELRSKLGQRKKKENKVRDPSETRDTCSRLVTLTVYLYCTILTIMDIVYVYYHGVVVSNTFLAVFPSVRQRGCNYSKISLRSLCVRRTTLRYIVRYS